MIRDTIIASGHSRLAPDFQHARQTPAATARRPRWRGTFLNDDKATARWGGSSERSVAGGAAHG
jgi:hypothetical protein